jgi:hypothetical protein
LASHAQTPTAEKTVAPTPAKKSHTPLKKKSKPAGTKSDPSATSLIAPWTIEWTKKYVIVTPKTGYSHTLIDVETLRPTFEGAKMHSAAALEALALAQSTGLLDPTVDLVKVDVVLFQNRDNYGSPVWDSMKRLAHFEFSAQALAKSSTGVFQKPEAEWTGSFKSVTFY